MLFESMQLDVAAPVGCKMKWADHVHRARDMYAMGPVAGYITNYSYTTTSYNFCKTGKSISAVNVIIVDNKSSG